MPCGKQGGLLKISLETVILIESNIKLLSSELSPGNYIKLEICDNGHGMDKTIQKKIFVPYFTTKKAGEGTGLGLSVIHGIVKSFGGYISVYSEPGKGTTFRIYFPQIIADEKITENSSKDIYPTGCEHILIVDDDESIVEIEKQMLETLGYKVIACMSSQEAFDIFKTQSDDLALVITDMTMPEMTGIELLQCIRSIRPDIPVIICSGFSDLIDEKKRNISTTLNT